MYKIYIYMQISHPPSVSADSMVLKVTSCIEDTQKTFALVIHKHIKLT